MQAFTVLESGDPALVDPPSSSAAAGPASSSLDPLVDVGTGAVAGAALVAMLIVLSIVVVVLKRCEGNFDYRRNYDFLLGRRFHQSSPYFVADSSDPDHPGGTSGGSSAALVATSANNKQCKGVVKLTTSFSTLEKNAAISDGTLKSKVSLTL